MLIATLPLGLTAALMFFTAVLPNPEARCRALCHDATHCPTQPARMSRERSRQALLINGDPHSALAQGWW